jgi:type IV secretion system protein TrbL
MRSRRMITPTIALVALSAAMPVAASASSLLSGYGGPGQGNQAILGSSLLSGGGPKSGGGGGGGAPSGGGGLTGTGASPTVNAQTRVVRGGKVSPARRHASGTHGKGKQGSVRAPAPTGGAQAYPASARGAAAGGSETLGLSSEDLLYVLLALCGLILTGMVTRRMARTTTASRHG